MGARRLLSDRSCKQVRLQISSSFNAKVATKRSYFSPKTLAWPSNSRASSTSISGTPGTQRKPSGWNTWTLASFRARSKWNAHSRVSRSKRGKRAETVSTRSRAANTAAEIVRLGTKVERIADLVDALQNDVVDMQRRGTWDRVTASAEAQDPGFDTFAREAIDDRWHLEARRSGASSGVTWLQQLQVSDDAEIVTLRRAMNVTADLTEPQLLALAAVSLVQNMADPGTTFGSCPKGRHGLRLNMLALCSTGKSTHGRTMTFRLSAFDRRVWRRSHRWNCGVGSDPGNAVDNWLLRRGVSAQDDLPADAGTAAWRQLHCCVPGESYATAPCRRPSFRR